MMKLQHILIGNVDVICNHLQPMLLHFPFVHPQIFLSTGSDSSQCLQYLKATTKTARTQPASSALYNLCQSYIEGYNQSYHGNVSLFAKNQSLRFLERYSEWDMLR